MKLAAEQIAWADEHVGTETTANGVVTGWEVDDEEVVFTVAFRARPPLTAAQIEAIERERQEAEDAARLESERAEAEAAEAAAAAEEAHRKEIEAARQRRLDAIDALPDVSQIFKDRLKEVLW